MYGYEARARKRLDFTDALFFCQWPYFSIAYNKRLWHDNYMNSARQTKIAFGTDKNGKRSAYRISYKFCPMRYFKMSMNDALAMLADGSAIEVEYMPWGGKECKAATAAMLKLLAMPTTGAVQ